MTTTTSTARLLVVLLLIVVLSIISSSILLLASEGRHYLSTNGLCLVGQQNLGNTCFINTAFSLIGTFGSIIPDPKVVGSEVLKEYRQLMKLRAQSCSSNIPISPSQSGIDKMRSSIFCPPNGPGDADEVLMNYMSEAITANDGQPDSKLFNQLTIGCFYVTSNRNERQTLFNIVLHNTNNMARSIGDILLERFSLEMVSDSKNPSSPPPTWILYLIEIIPEKGFILKISPFTRPQLNLVPKAVEPGPENWDGHIVMTNINSVNEFDYINLNRLRFDKDDIGTNRIGFFALVSICVHVGPGTHSGHYFAIVSTSTGVRFEVNDSRLSRSPPNPKSVNMAILLFKRVTNFRLMSRHRLSQRFIFPTAAAVCLCLKTRGLRYEEQSVIEVMEDQKKVK